MNSFKTELAVLGQKLGYRLTYIGQKRYFTNGTNQVWIEPLENKHLFKCTSKTDSNLSECLLNTNELIDAVYNVFQHPTFSKVQLNRGPLITLHDYIETEKKEAPKALAHLKKALQTETLNEYRLPGNRIEALYYKSFLILKDDLSYLKTNMIPFP